ncbi:meiosis-specific with OB domain-containing protein [Platysternon megacephalum]|uniref:Meiosis-specific with OB domain-containing protein n=1 Tax=Platysternon megacephalum TaxID=55544 RepID=A0A4D9EYB5_9SAUR|nr:meiosis-specific with OB domain-containing protein [Platysternon megacephalum]
MGLTAPTGAITESWKVNSHQEGTNQLLRNGSCSEVGIQLSALFESKNSFSRWDLQSLFINHLDSPVEVFVCERERSLPWTGGQVECLGATGDEIHPMLGGHTKPMLH